jgi:hypothetical protein
MKPILWILLDRQLLVERKPKKEAIGELIMGHQFESGKIIELLDMDL